MNYRTGKILLITSLLLLPAAFSPARGEEPAFSYTHIHREGSVSTMGDRQGGDEGKIIEKDHPLRYIGEPAFFAGGGRPAVSLPGKERPSRRCSPAQGGK